MQQNVWAPVALTLPLSVLALGVQLTLGLAAAYFIEQKPWLPQLAMEVALDGTPMQPAPLL